MDLTTKVSQSQAFKTLPNIKSSDTDWIKWSDVVVNKYGSNLGKQIFLSAWNKYGSVAANTYTLRSYIKKNYDLQIDETAWNKVADVGGGISDSVGKIFKVGKITLFIGLGITTVVILGMAYTLIKNPTVLTKIK